MNSNVRLRVVDVFALSKGCVVNAHRHRRSTTPHTACVVVTSFGYRYAIPIPINTTDVDVDVE